MGILVNKVLSLGVAAVLGLLAIIGLAPAAQAYPEVVIDLSVNRTVLYGGQTFTATATSNVDCVSPMRIAPTLLDLMSTSSSDRTP